MAAESTDQMTPPVRGSTTALSIEFRDYMREFVGTQMAIMEAKLTAADELHRQLAESTNRAVEKAEQQMNARLLVMNEFREQLQHQAATFATRAQVEGTRDALLKSGDDQRTNALARVEAIEKVLANWQGRLTVFGAVWTVVVIIISALVNNTIRTVSEPRVVVAPAVTTTTTRTP